MGALVVCWSHFELHGVMITSGTAIHVHSCLIGSSLDGATLVIAGRAGSQGTRGLNRLPREGDEPPDTRAQGFQRRVQDGRLGLES